LWLIAQTNKFSSQSIHTRQKILRDEAARRRGFHLFLEPFPATEPLLQSFEIALIDSRAQSSTLNLEKFNED